MDGSTFDVLTRRFTMHLSRRTGLGLLATLGGLRASAPDQTAAKKRGNKKKKPCPPCKKRKQGTCKKKKPDGTLCAGGTCQGGKCILATCSDGITNGTESDVDCGGSCPRCTNGKRCVGRDDCIGALCINNVCTSCGAIGFDCFSDAHGPCTCRNGIIGPVCTSSQPLAEVLLFSACPPGTTVQHVDEMIRLLCLGPCGGV
jgi:hypothetical protein